MNTYLIIGGVGVVLLVLALVAGDVLEGVFNMDLGLLDSDIFSTAGIGGLVGGFGFGAALVLDLLNNNTLAIIAGLAVGTALGFFAGWLTRKLKEQNASDTLSTNSLIGLEANVLSPVPAEGYGQVRLSYAGHRITLNARSLEPLEQGERVWINNVLSPTAVEVTAIKPGALEA